MVMKNSVSYIRYWSVQKEDFYARHRILDMVNKKYFMTYFMLANTAKGSKVCLRNNALTIRAEFLPS
jgi:hypothetical protein